MSEIPALPADFDPRAEFPILNSWTFLNHAGVAPISRPAREAIKTFAEQAHRDAYLTGRWYAGVERVRELAATFIGARPAEIAFAKNTSEGIAFVASGMDWRAGDQIISTAVEYPSMIYPWMDLAARFGVVHTQLPEHQGRFTTQQVLDAITPRTRMVALSHVEFASGFRHDLAAIGKVCRERGILLCVDAIQSAGALPVDVHALHIDFLSADGHKWLLAPEGAAIFFCRETLIPTLRPEIGWMNVINANDYSRHDFTLRPDARRFECGSHNIPGVLALGASIEMFLKITPSLIEQRIGGLVSHLRNRLAEKSYRVISSDQSGETSGIVAFEAPGGGASHGEIVAELERQRIIIVERQGRLRASPHFYNSPDDIDRLVDALPDGRET